MNALGLALLAALLFGASAPFGKLLLSSFQPMQLAGLLYLGAAAAVAPAVISGCRKHPLKLGRGLLLKLGGSLLFGGAIAPVLLMMALRSGSAASTSLWLSLEAPFTAVCAFVLFKEHLGKGGVVGIVGATLSALLLSCTEGSAGALAGALASGACLCWALDNNLTAIIDGVSAEQLTFAKGVVAGGINLTLGLVFTPAPLNAGQVWPALLLGALSYGCSLVCYIKAAQQLGATRSQAVFASAPFWGVLLSAFVLHENILPLQYLSGFILLVSLTSLFRDTHAHEHQHEPMSHIHEHSHDDGHHDHGHEQGLERDHEHGDRDSHVHWHTHGALSHSHPHLPDLHHRHGHSH